MTNRPIRKWRASNFEVALWSNKSKKNSGEEIEFKTLSLRRGYKKKDEDIWRDETINLRRNDIPKVMVLLGKVQEELLLNDSRDKMNDELERLEED
ncbi:MAG: hypothetical protein KKG60_00885 [Nanoarchaeota archaeon]|nr:hypothetical protein [Nanoarchaeota archaeon]